MGKEEKMDHCNKSLIPMLFFFLFLTIIIIIIIIIFFFFFLVNPNAQSFPPPILYHATFFNRIRQVPVMHPGLLGFAVAGLLSFIAATISSAGGIGGGGLFVPILIIIARLDVKTAMSYSAFMVTGGSIANVATHVILQKKKGRRIDYDIVLLSEPAMLLGVSVGVILNVVLLEWLITAFFVVLVAFCSFKTWQSGARYWRKESEEMRAKGESTKVPLLMAREGLGVVEGKMGIPWMKVGVLVAVWISFFLLNILRRNTD